MTNIDAHGLKIQGRGYLKFFAKIPRGGVKAFKKNCLGGSPFFGFYCIFINKCFEICLRGILYLPSPPPVCIFGDKYLSWITLLEKVLFKPDYPNLSEHLTIHPSVCSFIP